MRSTVRRRMLGPILLMLVALPTWAACGVDHPAPARRADGCGSCRAEIEALRAQVVGLDGVSEVSDLGYTQKVALTTPPTVTARITVTSGTPARVADGVAELVWKSPIAPVDEVLVEYRGADGIYQRPVFYRLASDRREYEKRWGPRPGD